MAITITKQDMIDALRKPSEGNIDYDEISFVRVGPNKSIGRYIWFTVDPETLSLIYDVIAMNDRGLSNEEIANRLERYE